MKVIFIIDTMLIGGAQKVLLSFANYLCKLNHNITIVSLKKACIYEINKDINYIELIPLNEKLTCNIFNILENLSDLSKKSDIIVSFGSSFSMYLVFTLGSIYKKPILLCIRNLLIPELSKYQKTMTVNIDLTRGIFQNSPILVQSESIKKDIINNFNIDSNNIIIIANPINKIVVKDLPIIVSSQDFIVVGRLSLQKNNQLILNAFSQLSKKSQKQIKIHFIGEGELLSELELLVKKLSIQDNIIFHGYIENPLPYIKKARCLILASTYEGMPNVILEAFSQHTLVLASDIEPTKELICNMKTGILFQNNNILDLSEKMEYILKNNLNICSNNAYNSLAKYENIDKDFENLLLSTIDKYTYIKNIES